MGTLQIKTTTGQAMLDAITTALTVNAAWAIYATGTSVDVDILPSGTRLKWGFLANGTPFASAAVSGSNDAAEVATITLNAEDVQFHDQAGTAVMFALFANVRSASSVADAANLTAANMRLKGDVAATGTPFLLLDNTTIGTGDVDLTQASCIITLPLTVTL